MAETTGGVLSGVNPFIFNSSSPITFFLIQSAIILILSNSLNIIISRLRQPKVISEVIAGIILGPTVFGQIPNYTETLFPADSITGLNLVANLGIVLFMFFLGMEVDISFVKKNAKAAVSIGLATLSVPFGFGCLFALPLYNAYDESNVEFKVFMMFIAVSLSVTAFPVLCRILTDLRLVKERVGVIVLTSGTINDVVGWILLALCIILSNSQTHPVNVVYILLCTFGWFLFCWYPVRLVLRWVLKKFHEFERESPSTLSTLLMLILVLLSAYFTDIIGVHPIFGGFIAGIIIPRERNYVSKLTARMEDIPNLLMIPIYFTIAGLNVDLTLLNEGADWGYTFASIGIAVTTKVISGGLLSKINGLKWRESLAVGILMSCKGIVEIVVLTTGLNAGIITKKIYAMFIFMALISTFITTPLTTWVFPDKYRNELKNLQLSTKEIQESNSLTTLDDIKSFHVTKIDLFINNSMAVSMSLWFIRILTCDRIPFKEYPTIGLPGKKNLTKTITNDTEAKTFVDEQEEPSLSIKASHLKLMSNRTAEIIESTNFSDLMHTSDNTLEIIRIFAGLFDLQFAGETILSSLSEKAAHITTSALSSNGALFLPFTYPVKESIESLSRILSFNDLDDDFFNLLSPKVCSNLFLLFGQAHSQKPSVIFALLSSATLTSSDILTVYITLLISPFVDSVKICVTKKVFTMLEAENVISSSEFPNVKLQIINEIELTSCHIGDFVSNFELDSRSLIILSQPSIIPSCLSPSSKAVVEKTCKFDCNVLICHYFKKITDN